MRPSFLQPGTWRRCMAWISAVIRALSDWSRDRIPDATLEIARHRE